MRVDAGTLLVVDGGDLLFEGELPEEEGCVEEEEGRGVEAEVVGSGLEELEVGGHG